MVSGRVFIFHIYIYWGKTLSLVSKSMPSVMVKYHGHSFQQNDRCGGISVSQTQLVRQCPKPIAYTPYSYQ